MPEELWTKPEPLLPPRPEHPLGCHNPRVPDRSAMEAILWVLRTGMQWQALKTTGLCHPCSAYRRFREWLAAGVFSQFWRLGLLAYNTLVSIDWQWMSLDGALTKAPLGGEKTGPNPTDRGKKGTKRSLLTDRRGVPLGGVAAGANVNDHKLLHSTFEAMPVKRPPPEPGLTVRRQRRMPGPGRRGVVTPVRHLRGRPERPARPHARVLLPPVVGTRDVALRGASTSPCSLPKRAPPR